MGERHYWRRLPRGQVKRSADYRLSGREIRDGSAGGRQSNGLSDCGRRTACAPGSWVPLSSANLRVLCASALSLIPAS
jgi:hypothetical protein